MESAGSDEFDDDADYYRDNGDDLEEGPQRGDPELFHVDCVTVEEVERFINELVEQLSTAIKVTPSLAKQLLRRYDWHVTDIVERHRVDAERMLCEARVKPPVVSCSSGGQAAPVVDGATECPVCMCVCTPSQCAVLVCGHVFCCRCWCAYFSVQVKQGVSSGLQCMAQECDLLVPEDFVLRLLTDSSLRQRYHHFAFSDCVRSHPQLRFCTGSNCSYILRAPECRAKRVVCTSCKSSFCFKCGSDYHAPTDCTTFQLWLAKNVDEGESMNYILANTKNCPKCNICIEKDGGCNHMKCFSCSYEFCWLCLTNWSTHTSHYECSRYKENPELINNLVQTKARENLKRYMHYYERWDNHAKSLALEDETRRKIADRIDQKVKDSSGTWIDWHYLLDAAALLARCRYTLQHTYPLAYYLQSGPRKVLFEYQQAQLESDVEDLSWKIERAETTDRADLENHSSRVERSRSLLLREFLDL